MAHLRLQDLAPFILLRGLRRLVQAVCLVIALFVGTTTEAGLFGLGGDSWKEEVLLHDGSTIIVERTVERGGRHEIGQKPPYKEQRLRFTLPGTNHTITWEDHFSQDLGQANFLPMALDISGDTPYLVVYPMGCLSYNKWGRPNPPYVVFQGKRTGTFYISRRLEALTMG